MTTAPGISGVGPLLRDWRQRRRLSQLDLALDAGVSARHLSFVETGRSRPSRELLLHLAERLEIPLRDRNALLLAAGYAPMYSETPLDGADLAPVRGAIDRILASHEPYPAVVVNRYWDLVSANRPATALLSALASPGVLEPPVNVLCASLHPEGLAPYIVNFGEYAQHLLHRLDRQAASSGDPEFARLAEELRSYPNVPGRPLPPDDPASRLFVPLVLDIEGRRLSFFSTIATFGTALDITIAELAIESFFPADNPTVESLRRALARADGASRAPTT